MRIVQAIGVAGSIEFSNRERPKVSAEPMSNYILQCGEVRAMTPWRDSKRRSKTRPVSRSVGRIASRRLTSSALDFSPKTQSPRGSATVFRMASMRSRHGPLSRTNGDS